MKMKKTSDDDAVDRSRRKSLYELSLTVAVPLWCIIFALHSRFGHGHRRRDFLSDDVGSNFVCRRTPLEFYFLPPLNNTYSCCGLKADDDPPTEIFGIEENIEDGNISDRKKVDRRDRDRDRYIGLDEFRNQALQRKESDADKLHGKITHRLELDGLEYNYAASSKGAKILDHNKEAKGVANILSRDKDMYLRNRCSTVPKFIVMELSEETLVDAIEIANLEHYSSNFKDFELLGSLSYPTETWTLLGTFLAENVKHAQRFMLSEPKWARYMKLNLVSHYGSEFYCTLSYIEVYGVDAIERMLEDLIVVSDEPAAGYNSVKVDPKLNDKVEVAQVNNSRVDDPVKLDPNRSKNGVSQESMHHPKQPSGRVPSDGILKFLMQKVRSMELSLTILEEYVKELNIRYSEALPDLQKQYSEAALLLQKLNSEIKELSQWKEGEAKELNELGSWRSSVSTEIDALVRENALFREDLEKIKSNQDLLESKELAVIVISLFFACVALFKLAWHQIMGLFKPCESHNRREYLLVFVCSSLIMLITLLYY
ncbi:SUN domain-containing protein 4-like [Zingiber officinale]|uniref:SUN domain-containing protein n=1 Tax=Zingiber officinale TaxID=94328 RepID=A0A8J5LGW4_ZINOF|nr:SUN domain-containing protein 4-like [Zingiber officinale]KAG6517685.1 hypothetical protein ZIOFF_021082 [Zingiber officinale]